MQLQPDAKAWGKAMTMPNIFAGFRVTGVYSLDRNVLRPKLQKKAIPGNMENIPIITPRPPRNPPSTPRFTIEEFRQFQEYLDERHDLPDERYQLWKRMYCPTSSPMPKEKLEFSSEDKKPAVRIL